MYKIVEKKNAFAAHGLFDTKDRAVFHLEKVIPMYVEKSYFMDKTLTKDDFMVVEDGKN